MDELLEKYSPVAESVIKPTMGDLMEKYSPQENPSQNELIAQYSPTDDNGEVNLGFSEQFSNVGKYFMEEVSGGVESIKEGGFAGLAGLMLPQVTNKESIDTGLGALQLAWSPFEAVLKAYVKDPVVDIAESAGADEDTADIIGTGVQIATEVFMPLGAFKSLAKQAKTAKNITAYDVVIGEAPKSTAKAKPHYTYAEAKEEWMKKVDPENADVVAQAEKEGSYSVKDLMNQWEGDVAAGNRFAWQQELAMQELVKRPKDREKLTEFIEAGAKESDAKALGLNEKELEAVKIHQDNMDLMFRRAKEEGVINESLDDYVAHFWRRGSEKTEDIISRLGKGMGTTTRHARERVIPTYKEGLELGLEPITLDLAKIDNMYTRSVERAVQNKRLVNALKKEVDADGNKLMTSKPPADAGYVRIDHPSLTQVRARPTKSGKVVLKEKQLWVHPEIADSVKMVFDSYEPGAITRALLRTNFASKRMLVSTSLFHANALLESAIFTGLFTNPISGVIRVKNALKMLREGGAGDMVDQALRGGVKIGTIDDIGVDQFYGMLADMKTGVDKYIPTKVGKAIVKSPVQAFEQLSRKIDSFMWDNLMTGMKLAAYGKHMEMATAKGFKGRVSRLGAAPRTVAEASEEAATFVNDAFGGLNWRRLAEDVQNRYGRVVAMSAFSKSGRAAMQLGMFAPDWTIANIRIIGKNFAPQKSGAQRAMYAKYLARSTLMYMTLADGVNLAMSGHHIWENEDKTTIDMGDGRRMVASKQLMEPVKWVDDFWKTGMNKLGIIPRTIAEFGQAKQWISAYGKAPNIWEADDETLVKWGKGLMHVGKKFVPIGIQQTMQQGPQAGSTGLFGHPIYGETEEQKMQRKIERKFQ